MSDISNLDKIGPKKKISNLASKPQVTLEKTEKKESVAHLAHLQEMKTYEIEMEQADHAFALMTEIRQKLETAYNESISDN